MKTTKIRGIEKSVCCAEQMIAYNICLAYYIMDAEWCADYAIRLEPEKYGKYNMELVAKLIKANKGIKYFGVIATNYEQVGKFFPLT